eukprot:403353717
MKQLLDYIQGDSGELDKYWSIVEKQNDDARRAARRLEKERRRLEMGSDYESSEGEQHEYYDDEDYTDSDADESQDEEMLESSRLQSNDVTGHIGVSPAGSQVDITKHSLHPKDGNFQSTTSLPVQELPFNAVRFLGEKLREVIRERQEQDLAAARQKQAQEQKELDSKKNQAQNLKGQHLQSKSGSSSGQSRPKVSASQMNIPSNSGLQGHVKPHENSMGLVSNQSKKESVSGVSQNQTKPKIIKK